MRLVFILFSLLIFSACTSGPFKELNNSVYSYEETGIEKYEGELKTKAIVVLRADYEEITDEHKKLTILFTTQSIKTPYSARILFGENDFSQSKKFLYESQDSRYVAIAIDPGTYRYIKASRGHNIHTRFSPAQRIEFTVKSGEAIYLGDLILYFNKEDYEERTTIFGAKRMSIKVNDYRFRVENNFELAKSFYSNIKIKPDIPLEHRPFLNGPMPNVEYYGDPFCNGFYNSYVRSRNPCK